MKKWLWVCMFSVLLLGTSSLTASESHAQRRGSDITITTVRGNVYIHAKIRGRFYRKIIRRGWTVVGRLWVRRGRGWVNLATHNFASKKWVTVMRKYRICGRSYYDKRVALQIAIRYGNWWFNRGTRGWQRRYIAIRQRMAIVSCPTIPLDFPPGTPPRRHARPSYPAPPVQPQPTHPPNPHPPQPTYPPRPTQPPPPAVVPDATAYSFVRAMSKATFDTNRLTLLKSWVGNLRGLKVAPRHVRKLLKTFSFDKYRLTGARILARGVLRPLQAREVLFLIKPFSFDTYRAKAAFYYCKGLADPLNAHVITKAFSLMRYRKMIIAGCR